MNLKLTQKTMQLNKLLVLASALAVAPVYGGETMKNAYFGETHVHTAYSLDAYIGGNRISPADAYRYAKGETVVVDGKAVSRKRPLDFTAVSDHAEYIGEMYSTMVEGAPGHDQDLLKQLRGLTTLKEKQEWFLKYVISSNRSSNPTHPPFFVGPETTKSAWQIMIKAAEEHNEPGKFTALVAFEWSGAPNGGNLHRNVIYRDSHVPELPVGYSDINREDGLWEWMAKHELLGMKALAIPHNSNASKGMMFPSVDAAGNPIDLEYAQTRQHFEPLIEMMQIKGNSEVHRKFWPADEFANFENADSIQENSDRIFHKGDFVREGLKIGVAYEKKLGVNPFKYGFIGGTDNHNGMPGAVVEGDFIGGHGPEDGSVERRREAGVGGWIDGKDLSIGSLAAVWASENTRAAIWDAMKRRETFVTSGPRIKVRFFGGVKLSADAFDPNAPIDQGFERAIPMGGDLGSIGVAPTFTVLAMKDPDGANLDRVQIIKGWLDDKGVAQEQVYDVALSDGRQVDPATGKAAELRSTVDIKQVSYTNAVGAGSLSTVWEDPDFDAGQRAFYYARVIEIPTPRWTAYDARNYKLELAAEIPTVTQERIYSSPIWYQAR
jgi:hypothetical protein